MRQQRMRKTYSPRALPIKETPSENILRRAKLVDAADAILAHPDSSKRARRAAQEYLSGEDPHVVGAARDARKESQDAAVTGDS